jgi:hypothetical protein
VSEERRVIFRIDADTTQIDSKTQSTQQNARNVELQFYRCTILIERMNSIAKQFFGVELPKWVTDAINELQGIVAMVRTVTLMANTMWGALTMGVGSLAISGAAAYQKTGRIEAGVLGSTPIGALFDFLSSLFPGFEKKWAERTRETG